jgi:hypothetical protein
MRRTTLAALAATLLVTRATAQEQQPTPAQPTAPAEQAAPAAVPHPAAAAPQPKPGAHTHDGFFLQLNGALGGLWSSAKQSTGDITASGAMAATSVTVGGAVARNLVLGAQAWEVAGVAPDVDANGQTTDRSTNSVLALFALGVNLTYYFMPANVFVSATPSFGRLFLARELRAHDTELGFALRLAAGKEWWVSDNWGLGLAVEYAYGANAERDGGPTWKTNAFGLAFSATYD